MVEIKRGVALVVALALMLILFTLGAAYVMIVRSETRITTNQINAMKAFYNAEAGLEYAIAELEIGEDRDADIGGVGVGNVVCCASKDSFVTDYNSDEMIITSTGTSGGATRKIEAKVEWQHPFVYVVESGGDINFNNAEGLINGGILYYEDAFAQDNIQLNCGVENSYGKRTPTASIDPASFLSQSPTIVSGSKTFTAAESPYEGIWYVEGTANIRDGAVINGTIVALGDITTQGNLLSLTINPSGPYALIAAGNISLKNTANASVTGFIYTGGELQMSNITNVTFEVGSTLVAKGNLSLANVQTVTFNGAMVADGIMSITNVTNINIRGALLAANAIGVNNVDNFDITYDPDLNPPDFEGGFLAITNWQGHGD